MALHVLSCESCKLAPLPAEDDLTPLIIERATADPSINVRRHAALALAPVVGIRVRATRWARRQRESRMA